MVKKYSVKVYRTHYNRLVERLSQKEALLEKAYETYDSLLEQQISSFEFDSGEADQRVTMRKIQDHANAITKLEAEIDLIARKLNGTANVRSLLCRRGY